MAAGIDGARIMKVARLRTERGEMERRWEIGRSFWRKPTENWKKRSEVCFWTVEDKVVRKRVERGRKREKEKSE